MKIAFILALWEGFAMDFFRFERRLQRQFELLRSEKGLDENKRACGGVRRG
jgi:hypothetical protein